MSISGGLTIFSGANPQNLPAIAASFSGDTATWSLQPAVNGDFHIRCDGWGILLPGAGAASYPAYQDLIWGYNIEPFDIVGTRVENWLYY